MRRLLVCFSIFYSGVKLEFSFLLLHVAAQFSQHYLLSLAFMVVKKLTLHLDLVLGFLRIKTTYAEILHVCGLGDNAV